MSNIGIVQLRKSIWQLYSREFKPLFRNELASYDRTTIKRVVLITAEYDNFYLVCCYTPNSQRELARLDYRMTWEDAFRNYLLELDKKKPVILCGDLNVAHQEIDLKNPKTNRKNAGFSDEERAKMTELLGSGFTDTFRHLYPDAIEQYSWWSYMGKARERNTGWRIDYFITSKRLDDKIQEAKIHQQIFGSDHCPVELVIDL